MKLLKIIFISIALTLISSCSNENEKSDAYGNFEADEMIIAAETQGKVIGLFANEGDEVKAGALLCVIDTTQLSLKIEQLFSSIGAVGAKTQDVKVQIDVLYKKKENIIREMKRIENLLKDSAATRKQFDDVKGELDVVERQIIATETQMNSGNRGILSEKGPLSVQIRQIADQIEKSKIKAIKDATVLTKYISEGEYAIPGKPLFKVADIQNMILRVYVPGDMLSDVKIGNKAEVKIDVKGGMKSYSGQIYWISAKAEFTPKIIQTKEERVNLVYAVKIKVPNDGAIKIGMPAEANFKK